MDCDLCQFCKSGDNDFFKELTYISLMKNNNYLATNQQEYFEVQQTQVPVKATFSCTDGNRHFIANRYDITKRIDHIYLDQLTPIFPPDFGMYLENGKLRPEERFLEFTSIHSKDIGRVYGLLYSLDEDPRIVIKIARTLSIQENNIHLDRMTLYLTEVEKAPDVPEMYNQDKIFTPLEKDVSIFDRIRNSREEIVYIRLTLEITRLAMDTCLVVDKRRNLAYIIDRTLDSDKTNILNLSLYILFRKYTNIQFYTENTSMKKKIQYDTYKSVRSVYLFFFSISNPGLTMYQIINLRLIDEVSILKFMYYLFRRGILEGTHQNSLHFIQNEFFIDYRGNDRKLYDDILEGRRRSNSLQKYDKQPNPLKPLGPKRARVWKTMNDP